VSIKRAKSTATLYEDCEDADLVLVPNAPLADALNRHLDRPHFGPFAITPRRLAARRREQAEDRLAFLDVVEQTDLSWKEASYIVGNVLQCWEYQDKADAILDYDTFTTEATRTAVEYITDMDTTSGRLTEFSIDDGTDVAVVGFDRLTELERSILPREYRTVDPFADGSFEPHFGILESPAAIVDTLLDTVTPGNAEDVAVVLDASSEYSSLVESAFDAAGVPYYGGSGFIDDPHHRAFLQLLRSGYAGQDTRVSDVRPLLTQLGMPVDIEHSEKRLSAIEDPAIDWLLDFREGIESYTFAAAVSAYEDVAGSHLDAFREELIKLGIEDDSITELAIDRLAFYLDAYDVPLDRENEGVLLADAKAAAYVGRPLVFYLGLDEGWTHSSPRRPWVDREQEFERNIQQFQLLLQNGVDQYYLVQDSAGGTPVTPCLYLEELLDREFDRFSDLDFEHYSRTSRPTQTGFEKEPLDDDIASKEIETISQSSLSTYANSPRDYFYSRLVDTPDRDYFREGTLFHDFAELYVNHPDLVTEETLDECTELLLDEVEPFFREVDRQVRRTKYRIGLETIVEILDPEHIRSHSFLTADSGWGENFFTEHYERSVDSPYAERWFENHDLKIKGKIDLVHEPVHLFDHKSGSKKSARTIVMNSLRGPPSDEPNFQALLYLTQYRTEQPDEELQFTFFHFLETLDDVVAGEADHEDCLTTVTYYPTRFSDYLTRRETFTQLQEEAARKCKKTFSKVEYDVYERVLDDYEFPDTRDTDELIESEFGRALTQRMKGAVGDYKYVKKGCKQALRHLLGIRNESYFADDVDAFEQYVDKQVTELNDRRAGDERFPVSGLREEPNYRYLNYRDCILQGEIQ
jgi:hypothetical protein